MLEIVIMLENSCYVGEHLLCCEYYSGFSYYLCEKNFTECDGWPLQLAKEICNSKLDSYLLSVLTKESSLVFITTKMVKLYSLCLLGVMLSSFWGCLHSENQ